MDRVIVYPGQIPLETDILNGQKNTMMGLGYLAQAAIGVGPTIHGLQVGQTVSPSLSVVINQGSMYQAGVIDQTAYSSVAADVTGAVVKQGLNAVALTFGPVPTLPSGGNKQIVIVQSKLVEQDIDNTVLPYYNSANPNVALNGPGGSGTAQPRTRQTTLQFSFKYGTATTGTPVAPSADSGAVVLAQFELRSTTTGISAAAQSSTNAQIKQYDGYPNGDPRVVPPYASLSSNNVYNGTQLFNGNVAIPTANLTHKPGVAGGESVNIDQFVPTLLSGAVNGLTLPTAGWTAAGGLTGGIILKWGQITALASGAATPVSFSPAFPNACFGVLCTVDVNLASPTQAAWHDSVTNAGFNLRATSANICQWLAIGR